jgi:2-C-methyl-D-erythritol 4-phosphate cytidylyltransferase
MNSKEYALIVAGGMGTRIKSETPKQFLELNGLPVLMHTILAFYTYSEKIKVVLVLPESEMDTWKSLCIRHDFVKDLVIRTGGNTRFQSVRNGLKEIYEEGLVAIHDVVRPLISTEIIAKSFQIAGINDTAVAAVSLKDSLRIAHGTGTKTVDRSNFKLIQTPQTFKVSLIKKAYASQLDSSLTDDASVAEKAGFGVTLFDGSYENIKITTAEDLVVAEALMKIRQQKRDGIKK